MSNIEVRELKKEDYGLWDELVKKSPHGTVFHNSNWLTTCSDLLNKKLIIYGCFKGDRLVGGCSLFIREKAFLKKATSTIRMTPYGGIVLEQLPSGKVRKQEQEYNNIIKSLREFALEHYDYIQLVNSPDFIDVRPFTWNGWDSRVQYAYYLDLNTDIKKTCSRDIKREIKIAIKNGIIVKKLSDISLFYDLFSMTFMRQNLKPPVTKNFFEKIIQLLDAKQLGEMWIAETPTGKAVSAQIILFDNKRAYTWATGSHRDLGRTSVWPLLFYTITQDLKGRFKEINLMSGNVQRLAEFITGFNPRLVPYYVVEKSSHIFRLYQKSLNIYKKLKK